MLAVGSRIVFAGQAAGRPHDAPAQAARASLGLSSTALASLRASGRAAFTLLRHLLCEAQAAVRCWRCGQALTTRQEGVVTSCLPRMRATERGVVAFWFVSAQ